jgi:hypothetical protein
MIPGHPHTVRSSDVPLYMRGFPLHLGQDDGSGIIFSDVQTPIDTSMYDPGANLVPPATLDPQTQALAQLYRSSVAAGTMTPAQGASAIAQLMTASASAAKTAQGLTTAPSPRVAVRPIPGKTGSILTSETIIPGFPDLAVIGLGAVIMFAVVSGAK